MISVTVPFSEWAFAMLSSAGCFQGKKHGQNMYDLEELENLDSFLSEQWFARFLSKPGRGVTGDFCYCHLGSLSFHLRKVSQ